MTFDKYTSKQNALMLHSARRKIELQRDMIRKTETLMRQGVTRENLENGFYDFHSQLNTLIKDEENILNKKLFDLQMQFIAANPEENDEDY